MAARRAHIPKVECSSHSPAPIILKIGYEMEIKGKVHCFFEQSGTFKNEFIKLGIPAEDYDIQNNFGQTDHQIDLFAEIENAYRGGQVSGIQLVAMI